MPADDQEIRLSVQLTPEIDEKLRAICFAKRWTKRQAIEHMIEETFAKEGITVVSSSKSPPAGAA